MIKVICLVDSENVLVPQQQAQRAHLPLSSAGCVGHAVIFWRIQTHPLLTQSLWEVILFLYFYSTNTHTEAVLPKLGINNAGRTS